MSLETAKLKRRFCSPYDDISPIPEVNLGQSGNFKVPVVNEQKMLYLHPDDVVCKSVSERQKKTDEMGRLCGTIRERLMLNKTLSPKAGQSFETVSTPTAPPRPSPGITRPSPGFTRPSQSTPRSYPGTPRPFSGVIRPAPGTPRALTGNQRPSPGTPIPAKGVPKYFPGTHRLPQGTSRLFPATPIPSQGTPRLSPETHVTRQQKCDGQPSTNSYVLIQKAVETLYSSGSSAETSLQQASPQVVKPSASPQAVSPETTERNITRFSQLDARLLQQRVFLKPSSPITPVPNALRSPIVKIATSKSQSFDGYSVRAGSVDPEIRREKVFLQPAPSALATPDSPRSSQLETAVKVTASSSGNISTEQVSCDCGQERPLKIILCRGCGETMSGRLHRQCPIHKSQIFLMDIQMCSRCGSRNLLEACSSKP